MGIASSEIRIWKYLMIRNKIARGMCATFGEESLT